MQSTPITPRGLLADAFFIIAGVLIAAFGLEGFLLPNAFIDGGVTGICLLLTQVTDLPLSVLLVIVNIPFLLLAHRVIGPVFAYKTAVAIGLLAFVLATFHFPELTQDKVLVAIFGGFFIGAGIGLTMRGGSVLDGTEILALFLSRRTAIKVSDWVILINVVIFGAAAALLSLEQALYSMLTYFVASKALAFIIDGIEEYTGVFIISKRPEEIRAVLIERLGYGVTIFDGRGGFDGSGVAHDHPILYTVITRLEIRKLTLAVQAVDERAFVTMHSIGDIRGGMVKRKVGG